ncbi:MAG TPA: acetate--CoA ligase family protein [Candidatus Polarisedimenticolia bacterium]|jgi:acetyl coenzyme A synthetase (ADP forming)-like protein|nr:acetate--CoA ligase family protein [Candidatus Polarisedimenticolia bacterium]
MDGALSAILRPRSIAVIGASRRPQSIGREILHNLIQYGFTGPIYPVNPHATSVHSIKCYPSLRDIPDPVDLAVVVVPKEIASAVVDDAVAGKVRGLVMITAGFREVGGEGTRLEQQIQARVRAAGIRMVGPNCMGVINTDPEIRMNATFAATRPEPGSVGFMSQSGALGEVILAHAHEIGLGIAYFVSMGNKADISGNDLIEAWEDDPRVNCILMYLESFGNPTRFLSIARRVTRKKPILAVKSGRTAAGARAAFSHTGALAGTGAAYDTLLDQAGVIRVDSMSEMFELATACAHQRPPRGNRVGILTNAGGPAIMATDACATLGLDVVELGAGTQEKLRRVLVPEASVRNPVDMVAGADASSYAQALAILQDDDDLDGLIVIFVSPIMINALEVARAIIAASKGARVPILTCFMGKEQGRRGVEELRRAGVPVYLFPEEAARALAGLDHHRRVRERVEGTHRAFDVDRRRAAAVLEAAAAAGRAALAPEETEALLRAYGLPLAPSRLAADAQEAVAAARALGFPVVIKGVAESLVHKSEAGAVRLDLRNAEEVETACAEMRGSIGDPRLRFQVQAMVRGGRETILGIARDPRIGPMLMFGLGGIFVEVMKDVVFRILPVTDVEAREMVRGIRGHPVLAGARGGPPADEGFLVEALLRLGQLAADHPSVEQVDINPLLAGPDRASSFVVDARVRVALTAPGSSVIMRG